MGVIKKIWHRFLDAIARFTHEYIDTDKVKNNTNVDKETEIARNRIGIFGPLR